MRALLLLNFCLVSVFLILSACNESGDNSNVSDGDLGETEENIPDGDLEESEFSADGDMDSDSTAETELEDEAEPEAEPVEPTYWSEESTQVIDDINFLQVDGKPFFAIGMHAGSGLVYDGVSGENECDESTGQGYVDINIEKHHAAAEAGANFVYLWGYKDDTVELLDVEPRFHGIFHGNYGISPAPEDDLIPIVYNRFGETDLEGFSQERADEMRSEYELFKNREGAYSIENMPNLPPVDQVGHMAWHPTFRMIGGGDGEGEKLTDEQADEYATTTNMMIGDAYSYVENRYDMNDPFEHFVGELSGQKGEKGEDYEYWLENDDPDHRSFFSTGFDLSHSLVTRRNPDAVVWMWIQGYAFGNSIARSLCQGEATDAWATGKFPPLSYMEKEVLSTIVAGSTGIVFFGFPDNLWPETEIMLKVFRALSSEEVYEPALLSPRLDMGMDTTFMGEEGYDGKGRAHIMVKWHADSRTAYVIASNPGARATTVDLPFPWTLDKVERLDWDRESPAFVDCERLNIADKTLHIEFNRDEGMLIRVTPIFVP